MLVLVSILFCIDGVFTAALDGDPLWLVCCLSVPKAAAAGLGGRGLAAAFAALCLNFKHFGGGLPDLLLMRAVRTGVRSDPLAGDSSPSGVAAAVTPETEVSTVSSIGAWCGIGWDRMR